MTAADQADFERDRRRNRQVASLRLEYVEVHVIDHEG